MHSILYPLTCGFLKVKVFNLLIRDSYKLGNNNTCRADKSYIHKGHCLEIKDLFHGFESFCFDSKFYNKNLTVVKKLLFDVGKASCTKKEEILQIFSENYWGRLTLDEKKTHTLRNCNGCLSDKRFKNGLSRFPVNKKSKIYYAKALAHGLIPSPKRKPLKDITNTVAKTKITKREENRIKKQVVREFEAIKNASAINRYVLLLFPFKGFIFGSTRKH